MTQNQFNTESRKDKHLSLQERVAIQEKHREGWSNRKIAAYLGRAPQTINNELKRGSAPHRRKQTQKGKDYLYDTMTYFADKGQAAYEQNRLNCRRPYKLTQCADFIAFADGKMQEQKPWSPEATILHACRHELFSTADIPCVRTLYNWIDLGFLQTINLDLLLKTRRKTKCERVRKNRTNLGRSIEERPKSVADRQEFGHWEIDTVVGSRAGQGAVLVTLVERKTRYEIILKADGKNAEAVTRALDDFKQSKTSYFSQILKTVTSDNGGEFARLTECLKETTDVYFTHPYSSWERGTNENHNGLIRRFIPKGTDITQVSKRTIQATEDWMNNYPRRILQGRTPIEAFAEELLAMEARLKKAA